MNLVPKRRKRKRSTSTSSDDHLRQTSLFYPSCVRKYRELWNKIMLLEDDNQFIQYVTFSDLDSIIEQLHSHEVRIVCVKVLIANLRELRQQTRSKRKMAIAFGMGDPKSKAKKKKSKFEALASHGSQSFMRHPLADIRLKGDPLGIALACLPRNLASEAAQQKMALNSLHNFLQSYHFHAIIHLSKSSGGETRIALGTLYTAAHV